MLGYGPIYFVRTPWNQRNGSQLPFSKAASRSSNHHTTGASHWIRPVGPCRISPSQYVHWFILLRFVNFSVIGSCLISSTSFLMFRISDTLLWGTFETARPTSECVKSVCPYKQLILPSSTLGFFLVSYSAWSNSKLSSFWWIRSPHCTKGDSQVPHVNFDSEWIV